MRRLARSSTIGVALAVAFAAVAIAVNATWKNRAENICSEQAPSGAAASSVTWRWRDAAYVCAYEAPAAEPRRIGIIEALHGDRGPRHPGR